MRDLAPAPLQIAGGTSIRRTSFNRTGRDLHDFVAFADRKPALDDVLARYVFGLLEAISASFDRAPDPDRFASQVKANLK
jgi:hypothetical protein